MQYSWQSYYCFSFHIILENNVQYLFLNNIYGTKENYLQLSIQCLYFLLVYINNFCHITKLIEWENDEFNVWKRNIYYTQEVKESLQIYFIINFIELISIFFFSWMNLDIQLEYSATDFTHIKMQINQSEIVSNNFNLDGKVC